MIRKMTLLSAIFIISLPLSLNSPGWTPCPISIPTVSFVSRCPSNALEWTTAAGKKNCKALEQHQNCSSDGSFEYHCVLNLDGTKLMEVCAPIWYMSGFCARFSLADQKIVNDPGLDCTRVEPLCPTRFPSNDSYKYQMCYRGVSKTPTRNKNLTSISEISIFDGVTTKVIVILLIVLVASFGMITIVLLILLFVRFECKWKRQPALDVNKKGSPAEDFAEGIPLLGTSTGQLKENGQESITRNKEIKEWEILSLSGKRPETYPVQDTTTIRDVRESLSQKLQEPLENVLIVDMENGKIFQDDINLKHFKKEQLTLMVGNKNRTGLLVEDGYVDKDVISNRHITKGKFKMCCGHFTAPETLFDWMKDEFPNYTDEELQCPKCDRKWDIDEVFEKCNLSEDEEIFFKRVKTLYLCTRSAIQEFRDLEANIDARRMAQSLTSMDEVGRSPWILSSFPIKNTNVPDPKGSYRADDSLFTFSATASSPFVMGPPGQKSIKQGHHNPKKDQVSHKEHEHTTPCSTRFGGTFVSGKNSMFGNQSPIAAQSTGRSSPDSGSAFSGRGHNVTLAGFGNTSPRSVRKAGRSSPAPGSFLIGQDLNVTSTNTSKDVYSAASSNVIDNERTSAMHGSPSTSESSPFEG
ncbi:uncharacterized protein LOC111132199 isoform X4 [Crassostrea virginica]